MSTDIVKLSDMRELADLTTRDFEDLGTAPSAQCCQRVSELVVCSPALVNSLPTDLRMK